MNNLIKNPIFRVVGVIAILYYGLFTSDSQKSLKNRLSSENIQSNIKEISSKSVNIIYNLQKAEKIKKEVNQKNNEKNK